VRTLCARRARAVNTLQQLLTRCENVMDAVKTLWERCVDVVGTLWGRCVHAIDDKFDIFRCIPKARWHGFRTLYKRCGNAVWCDRGLNISWTTDCIGRTAKKWLWPSVLILCCCVHFAQNIYSKNCYTMHSIGLWRCINLIHYSCVKLVLL